MITSIIIIHKITLGIIKMKNIKLSLALVSILTISSSAFGNDTADIAELKQQVKELQEMTQVLTDETSDLQTGFNYTTVDSEKSYSGLGPAASKVYYSKSPLSIGGYGEMYYANTKGGDSETQVKRFITYFGYKFSDNIILNTEIEYEGGGVTASGSGDEVIIEFMYLDFLQNKNFNARVGNFLMPVGLINEQHEPTLFTTVQRPKTSYYLIPSTWHESGVMAYGNIVDGLEYKAAVTSALQTKADSSPKGSSLDKPKWIRSGRGGSFEVKNPTAAFTGRVDYTGLNGLMVGASIYYAPSSKIEDLTADVFMYDVHVDYKINGFRVYGLYTETSRNNATNIANISTNTTNSAVEKAKGGYLNASFDVLSLTSSQFKLPIFIQYESVNARAEVVNTSANTNYDAYDAVNTTTVGMNFFPHEQVVLKLDYAMADNSYLTNNGQTEDTASVSIGFIF